MCLLEFKIGEPMSPADLVVQLSCNPAHVFHAECLKQWVDMQFTCPICREILLADKTDKAKLARYQSIVKRNLLIQLQNDDDENFLESMQDVR